MNWFCTFHTIFDHLIFMQPYLSLNRSNYSSKVSNLSSFSVLLLILNSSWIISILSFPGFNKNRSNQYLIALKPILFRNIYDCEHLEYFKKIKFTRNLNLLQSFFAIFQNGRWKFCLELERKVFFISAELSLIKTSQGGEL